MTQAIRICDIDRVQLHDEAFQSSMGEWNTIHINNNNNITKPIWIDY